MDLTVKNESVHICLILKFDRVMFNHLLSSDAGLLQDFHLI